MTNETSQRNIWKVRKTLEILARRHQATAKELDRANRVYSDCYVFYNTKVKELMDEKVANRLSEEWFKTVISNKEAPNPSHNYGRKASKVQEVIKNLDRTFGASENPINDLANMVGSNFLATWKSREPRGWYFGTGGPNVVEHEEYRDNAMPVAYHGLKMTKEERKLICDRKMSRQQFEIILLRTMQEGANYDRYESLPLGAYDNNTFDHNPRYFFRPVEKMSSEYMAKMLQEMTSTPYADRATIGSQPIVKPYEVQEFTPEEWEVKKAEILKPTEEQK